MASAVTACTSPWMITRAYRPPTNGKAERVIRTLLSEWAYARAFVRSYWRTRAFDDYLIFYHSQRRRSALTCLPPASRLPAGRCRAATTKWPPTPRRKRSD